MILKIIRKLFYFELILISLCSWTTINSKPQKAKPSVPVSVGPDGRLVYIPDELGNRIPDFSYCGYMASGQEIPNVPVRVVVPLLKGDATLRIQAAIDYVASLPANKQGIRGAVLLEKGTYEIDGCLKINTSGVVLRGSGMGENGTILLGAGTGRETLISISGK
ncbi:MAG: pectate lyase, partial [Bacteroidota bacterium]|nr:pectate lyase [Bacteroidota bacterium]